LAEVPEALATEQLHRGIFRLVFPWIVPSHNPFQTAMTFQDENWGNLRLDEMLGPEVKRHRFCDAQILRYCSNICDAWPKIIVNSLCWRVGTSYPHG